MMSSVFSKLSLAGVVALALAGSQANASLFMQNAPKNGAKSTTEYFLVETTLAEGSTSSYDVVAYSGDAGLIIGKRGDTATFTNSSSTNCLSTDGFGGSTDSHFVSSGVGYGQTIILANSSDGKTVRIPTAVYWITNKTGLSYQPAAARLSSIAAYPGLSADDNLCTDGGKYYRRFSATCDNCQ